MPMTITEKILAAHAVTGGGVGTREVAPGDYILAKLDLCLANDITAPIAIREFNRVVEGTGKGVFDKSKVALIPDHFTPNKDIKSAEQCQVMREFAREHEITHYYEVGRVGIEHVFLPEQGIVAPGDLVIGADSHTCTYGALGAFSTGVGSTDLGVGMALGEAWLKVPPSIKFVFEGTLGEYVSGKDLILHTIGMIGVDGANYSAMEFTGPAIGRLSMAGRFTMCNMAIEAGAKSGIIVPDAKTREYVEGRALREPKYFSSDPEAEYSREYQIDCGSIEPQVAFPHLPENAKPISEVEGMRVEVDQVVIGSCTNGRFEDLEVAAEILKGRQVDPKVRCIVIPGSPQVYLRAIEAGLVETFVKSNAIVSTPTCGPCLGGHMGVLGDGERALSTTNRNFVGRMGHPKSEVYLASPAVAAATAVRGYIAHPKHLEGN
ncbi:MAG: 3-isopropylmalate dehydratase large subunit [Promethearchaeota archaeon]